MKIVVLDGHTIVQDDLNWDGLKKFGQITVYDQTPYEEDVTVERIGDADVVMVSKVPMTASVMDRCPNLRYIGVTATGYNIVDVNAAKARNIIVTNVPGYGTDAVAEFVFALLLHLTRQIGVCNESVKKGDWISCKDFCYLPCNQMSLNGKYMGIIGFGQIGRRTAQLAEAFGMKLLVYTRHPKKEEESENLTFVTLEELYQKADVISLHCPLTEENYHMIDKNALERMKKTAFLINTSRGPLIDEQALAEALLKGSIQAAALDVVEQEPMSPECPLKEIDNCIITPHIAWASNECRELLIESIIKNLEAFLNGAPVHVVSK
ncbi:MAG: D-2-hydroxyacid dehydrogenase [Lachnospiraceae bacterium]|nr:D-2-hydroxyacid dehydrogenase [Lachnospiraceae bacterium]